MGDCSLVVIGESVSDPRSSTPEPGKRGRDDRGRGSELRSRAVWNAGKLHAEG